MTAIPKGALTLEKENYRPISITHILLKVVEKLISQKLSSFGEKFDLSLPSQCAHRKGLGCGDSLLTFSHDLQRALNVRHESYVVQLDFSAAFYKINHSGLIYKLKSLGVGRRVLVICRALMSNSMQ